jgi:hypothetical protein
VTTPCDERDRLLAEKESAFSAWYEARNHFEALLAQRSGGLVQDARSAAEKAERKVQHTQRALSAHYAKHRCNLDE